MQDKLTPEQVKQKRQLRDILFKAIFALDYGSEIDDQLLLMIVSDINEREGKEILLTDGQREQIIKKAKTLQETQEELDEMISKYIQSWKIDRLTLVDLTILRLAVYELLYEKELPPSVVINEAVILSGNFHDEKAKSFVNGTLSSINKALAGETETE